MAEIECATCGDTFTVVESRKETARFCSMACLHGKPVTLECESCGDEFSVVASRQETARYCSTDCLHGRSVKLECAICGDKFEVPQTRANTAKYCSRKCLDLGRRRRVDKICENCGSGFTVPLSHGSQRFCSFDCRGQVIRGESHPTWDGGRDRIYYGPSWDRQRQRALERDDRQCVICGINEKGHRSLTGKGLHVHHKTPFRSFESHSEANQLENLMTVCRSCHTQLEPVSQNRAAEVV